MSKNTSRSGTRRFIQDLLKRHGPRDAAAPGDAEGVAPGNADEEEAPGNEDEEEAPENEDEED